MVSVNSKTAAGPCPVCTARSKESGNMMTAAALGDDYSHHVLWLSSNDWPVQTERCLAVSASLLVLEGLGHLRISMKLLVTALAGVMSQLRVQDAGLVASKMLVVGLSLDWMELGGGFLHELFVIQWPWVDWAERGQAKILAQSSDCCLMVTGRCFKSHVNAFTLAHNRIPISCCHQSYTALGWGLHKEPAWCSAQHLGGAEACGLLVSMLSSSPSVTSSRFPYNCPPTFLLLSLPDVKFRRWMVISPFHLVSLKQISLDVK